MADDWTEPRAHGQDYNRDGYTDLFSSDNGAAISGRDATVLWKNDSLIRADIVTEHFDWSNWWSLSLQDVRILVGILIQIMLIWWLVRMVRWSASGSPVE